MYNCKRGATTDDPWIVDGEVNSPPSHVTTVTVARSSQDAHVTT